MQIDITLVEQACKDLYIRALKILPPDIKAGFKDLVRDEGPQISTVRNYNFAILPYLTVVPTRWLICSVS